MRKNFICMLALVLCMGASVGAYGTDRSSAKAKKSKSSSKIEPPQELNQEFFEGGRNEHPASYFEAVQNKFIDFYEAGIPEKIYLQLDKPYYSAGESIWFKGYLVNAITLKETTLSQFIYVELINREFSIIQRIKVKADEWGFHNCLALPADLPEGDYMLRAYSLWMQNSDTDLFGKRMVHIGNRIDNAINSQVTYEKLESGEIMATITLTDMNAEPIYNQKFTYYLNVNNKTKKSTALTNDLGVAVVRFSPPQSDSSSSDNNMRLVIDNGKKSFDRTLFMPPLGEDFDLQFFPEGGHLLPLGLQVVAFKAIGMNGLSVEVTGKLLDQAGSEITALQSEHKGMGRFVLNPQAGAAYYAEVTAADGLKKRFELPTVEASGYTLHLVNRGNQLLCKAGATPDLSSLNLAAVILINGRYLAAEPFPKNKELLIHMNTDSLPAGVGQVVLVDMKTGTALCQRAFFVRDPMQAEGFLGSDQENYGERELVNLQILLTDTKGAPLSGNFGLSVTERNTVQWDPLSDNIQSNLLLSSELKGYIEEPGYYFLDRSDERDYFLDLLLLTQGWSRYNLSAILQGKVPTNTMLPEQTQSIAGSVVNGFGQPPKNASVSLISLSQELILSTQLENEGRFRFSGLDFADSTQWLVQSLNKRDGTHGIGITIDQQSFPDSHLFIPNPSIAQRVVVPDNYLEQSKKKYFDEGGMQVVDIKEVEVNVQQRKPGPEEGFIATSGGNATFSEDYFKTFQGQSLWDALVVNPRFRYGYDSTGMALQYLGRAMGPNDPWQTVSILMINSMRAQVLELHLIRATEVASVSVMEAGNAGQYYGFFAEAGAVIIIQLKAGVDRIQAKESSPSLALTVPLGYKKPETFYAPKYSTRAEHLLSKPDRRTTIHWDPCMKTNETGEASISFYTGEKAGIYDIILEGVTNEGKPCRFTRTLERTKE